MKVLDPPKIEALKEKDSRLAWVIDEIGDIHIEADQSLFESLIHQLFKQQISTALAEKIWFDFSHHFDHITPELFSRMQVGDLSGFGISKRRLGWVIEIAKILASDPEFEKRLLALEDEQMMKELMKLPGVGLWTAEMVSIFYFQKEHIFSYGDMGILGGLMMVYDLKEKPDKALFEDFRKKFYPYETIAGLYIWKVYEGFIPEIKKRSPTRKKEDEK